MTFITLLSRSNLLMLFAELYKMVCGSDETDLNIHIPAVMLPLDASTRLEILLLSTSSDKLSMSVQIYSSGRLAVER
ncbi:hypothetical protein Lal_00013958 [Lupinus albus]|nr:hypothetical protein Lal_00013958 [Lupinus albus]